MWRWIAELSLTAFKNSSRDVLIVQIGKNNNSNGFFFF